MKDVKGISLMMTLHLYPKDLLIHTSPKSPTSTALYRYYLQVISKSASEVYKDDF